MSRAFKAALGRVGLPDSRFHDLRHAIATFLLARGMGLEDVKNQLGHSSITLTPNTFGRVIEQRQREVAGVMDAVPGGRGRGSWLDRLSCHPQGDDLDGLGTAADLDACRCSSTSPHVSDVARTRPSSGSLAWTAAACAS